MRKVLAVVRREFVERVRTRWFWISALLGPIFFAALIFLPYLFSGGRAKRLVVVDGTQSAFGANVADSLNTSGAFTLLNRMAPRAGLLDSLTGEVSRRRLDGFLIVTDGPRGALVIEPGRETQVETKAVENPVDICGAGDSFAAAFAMALAVTGHPVTAARLGNLAASVTIMKKGTGTASPEEILAAEQNRTA